MAKRNSRKTKTAAPQRARSSHDRYELPAELDFGKLKYVGTGVDSLARHVAAKRARTVVLEPDVAEAFPTAQQVNEALRAVLQAAQNLHHRKRKASA